MAAIEKICEYSGEYPGYAMYQYKRDHIQIMPKHRPMFKGAVASLHIFKAPRLDGFYVSRRGKLYHDKRRDYVLKVSDLALQGRVSGHYQNTSDKIGSVIRRMKRLTGNYRLSVFRHKQTYHEWLNSDQYMGDGK